MIYETSESNFESISAKQDPSSLSRPISPPPATRRRYYQHKHESTTAAVEAGQEEILDHLTFFSEKLQSARRPQPLHQPRLDHRDWINLYTRNLNDKGHHFVVHQHDHPVAGTHYDLRLQCNATSSISFAIMYGLPGDPNSRRLNRNATETRVHNLWNHLIETASHQTGTMLLWDTGEYEVLPYVKHSTRTLATTDDENDDDDDTHVLATSDDRVWHSLSEPQKLHRAFQQRKLRLRLNGTRLPKGYTISLRLTTENFRNQQPGPPKRRRRRFSPPSNNFQSQKSQRKKRKKDYETTDSESDLVSTSTDKPTIPALKRNLSSLKRTESPPLQSTTSSSSFSISKPPSSQSESPNHPLEKRAISISLASEDEVEHSDSEQKNNNHSGKDNKNKEDQAKKDHEAETIRRTNAYPGATNDINSIHQRRWYLSLDRTGSGFVRSSRSSSLFPRSDSNSLTTKGEQVRWVARSSSSLLLDTDDDDDESREEDEMENNVKKSKSRPQPSGFVAFHVRGREHETSIVTGRLASDILVDEGVHGYVPRGLWRGITD